jgi:hypothetical protein
MSREGGEYQIAASELYRVFPANSNSNGEIERLETLEETGLPAVLQAQLDGSRRRPGRRSTGRPKIRPWRGGTPGRVPENKQAPTAQPEQTQGANSGQEQESTPKTGWTPEERQARIDAERERQEARDRDYSNDNDPGREM